MADDKMMNETRNQNENKQSESMQREQGQSGFDKNRQPEQGSTERSAIGGGQTGQSPSGQQSGEKPTGEAGRARNELDESRSEPTSR